MKVKGLLMLAGAALSVSGAAALAQSQSSDEVRAVVAEMLSDAETRSSLLAGGDAGHDGSDFFIAGDGFRLNVGGQLQFRYILNFRDDGATAGSARNDDFTHGFQTRRVRFDVDGELNKDWFFRVRFRNDNGDSASVDYAYAGYKFANGLKATWGQFKLPLLREEMVSSAKQLAAERSFTNGVYTQGFSQGVQLSYEQENWRGFFAFSDGLNSANTDFIASENTAGFGTSGQAEYAVTGRGEFLFSGNFKQFEDFTSAKGSDFGFLLGAALHWQQSDNTPVAGDQDRDTFQYTVDASLEGDSWNLFGAFIGRYQETSIGAASSDFNDFGAVVQGGWRFAENTELFGRWDAIFADSDRGLTEDTYNFLTVGLNQYYAGHAAKATLDVLWSFENTGDLAAFNSLPDTGVGIIGQTDENEVAIRLQFQLLF